MGPGTLGSTSSALHHPSVPQVHALCSVFLNNFDRFFKVLHGPSLKRYLYREAKDLDCSPGPRGLEALEFALYYAATTTLTAEQCMRQIGEEKSTLLIRYRSSTELALARADFVNSVELSTLQALVIFLVSFFMQDVLLVFSPHQYRRIKSRLTDLCRFLFAATTQLGSLGRFQALPFESQTP